MTLPSNWSIRSFDEIAEVITGTTPSKKHPEYYGGNIPFVTPGDLDSNKPITMSPNTLTELGATQARLLPRETVMVCCIGATIGKTGIAGTKLTTNQQINSLVCDSSIAHPEYVYQYSKTLKPSLRHMSTSTTLPIVNKGRFKQIKIPLPPLEEQQRIAAILDKADALRAQRRAALAKLDTLLQATFLDMFGDPVTNPMCWERVKLGSLSKRVTVGHVGPTSHGYVDDGIPFLRTQNVRPNRINFGDLKYITPEFHTKLKKSQLREGDVLISRVGANRGMSAVVPSQLEGANCANVLIITPGSELIPEYLAYLINSPAGQRDLLGVSVGSAQGVINTKRARVWPVLLPPLDLQNQFKDALAEVNQLRSQMKEAEFNTDTLFRSLQQRAFKGELYPAQSLS